jgi:hypothetical protein
MVAQSIATRDLPGRIAQADALRAMVRDPDELARAASALAGDTPDRTILLAWSNEGFAVAAACSVVALRLGKQLTAERASHVAPLAPSPSATGWRWRGVEEALGFGPTRQWALEWATVRGGQQIAPGRLRDSPVRLAS